MLNSTGGNLLHYPQEEDVSNDLPPIQNEKEVPLFSEFRLWVLNGEGAGVRVNQ